MFSTGQTAALAHTLHGSNDVFPRKDVPFGVRMTGDVICGKYAPPLKKNLLKIGVNKQFSAKLARW